MNTYNENLRTTIVDSLRAQELELKSVDSAVNASEFSLFYAQGARINDIEKLEAAKLTLEKKEEVKQEAVKDDNISTNMVMSTDQELKYVTETVANAAVSAANVEAAANAIVKLAGDMGSIYSILQAADFGTDIYNLGQRAYNLINTTAYHAEDASLIAMEASAMTAEISAKTVSALAKSTDASMDSLLKTASAEYDKAAATVTTDNAALAEANTKEKAAEGTLEDNQVEHEATSFAYDSMNTELNLDLKITDQDAESFTVKFNPIVAPFEQDDSLAGYPVDAYYIMVAKNKNKSTFLPSAAENILEMEYTDRYTKIDPPSIVMPIAIDGFIQKIEIAGKKDTDGDDIVLGENYVVFVFATYYLKYKKKINNFSDFLSAPSLSFTLTYTLLAPKSNDITGQPDDTKPTSIQITLPKEANANFNVAYRFMYLPYDQDLTEGLLNTSDLQILLKKVESIEEAAKTIDPQVAKLSEEIAKDRQNLEKPSDAEVKKLQKEINALTKKIEDSSINASEKRTLEAQKKKLTTELNKQQKAYDKQQKDHNALSEKIKKDQEELKKLKAELLESEKAAALTAAEEAPVEVGFFFDLAIAESIPFGNYTVGQLSTQGDSDKQTYIASLELDTTDVFGTPLINDNQYVTAVLVASTEPAENLDQYTSALAIASTAFTFDEAAVSAASLLANF